MFPINVSVLTIFSCYPGEEKPLWSGIQFNASESSIDISWSPPPSGLLGSSSVQKYLLLHNSNPVNSIMATYTGTLWLPGYKTFAKILGLQPFTNYSMIVIAILGNGSRRINTGWVRVQTAEGGKAFQPVLFAF